MNSDASLLIVDPQNDFVNPKGALYVPGACEDMLRLASLVDEAQFIRDIFVTLDSHNAVHIAHPVCWVNSNGDNPAPFTQITEEDVVKGRWIHAQPAQRAWSQEYLKKLKKLGRSYPMIVWPPHCLLGTWGHNVHPSLAAALRRWEERTGTPVHYIIKGDSPMTEHYSALRADVPTNDPKTHTLEWLIRDLEASYQVLVAGEASSHCVNYTVRDLMSEFSSHNIPKLTLLQDAMSPVTGFEEEADALFKDVVAAGGHIERLP